MNGLEKFDPSVLTEHEQNYFEMRATKFRELQSTLNRQTAETVAAMGEILLDAKERMAHLGNKAFLAWAESSLGIGQSAVYRAIQTHQFLKGFPHVGKNFEPTALREIVVSTCPEPAKNEALRIANAGKVVTHKIAKQIIEKHRPKTSYDLPSDYSPHGKPKSKSKRRKTEPDHIPDAGKKVEEQTESAQQNLWEHNGDCEPSHKPSGDATNRVASEPEEPPTAASLAVEISRARRNLKSVSESIDGGTIDQKTAGSHLACVEALLHGDEPKHRLVKAGDLAGQAAELYDLYPRRVGRDKAIAAIRAALKKTSFDELREAVCEYAKARDGKDDQFTPHPATWFGQGRWSDDRKDWWRDDDRGRGSRRREPWEDNRPRQDSPNQGVRGVF